MPSTQHLLTLSQAFPPSMFQTHFKPLHPRPPLQLPNLLTGLTLPHFPGHLLPRLLSHNSHIPHLLPRRRLIARRPPLGILYRRSGLGRRVLRVLILQLVDLGRGFGFVQGVGVDGGVFARGEGGDEAFLFFGGRVGAGGPLARVVELGGHCWGNGAGVRCGEGRRG